MSRDKRDVRYATALDLLDLLQIDAGQRTVAELLGERALAAAEIATLRAQVESLKHCAAVRPDRVESPPNVPPRSGRATAVHSQQQTAPNRTEPLPPNALLRLTDVCRLVGLSRSTIYKRVSDGTFPRPLRVSERSVRWRMQDVLEWTAGPAE